MNKYQYKVQGVDYDVEIVDVEGNIAKVSVNGIPFEVELKEPIKASHLPKRPAVKPAAAPAAAPAPGPAARATDRIVFPPVRATARFAVLLLLLQVLVQRCWLRCLEPSRKSR